MRLLSRLLFRRSAAKARRTDRAANRIHRREQFERSHEFRKFDGTEANKHGMRFNGL